MITVINTAITTIITTIIPTTIPTITTPIVVLVTTNKCHHKDEVREYGVGERIPLKDLTPGL